MVLTPTARILACFYTLLRERIFTVVFNGVGPKFHPRVGAERPDVVEVHIGVAAGLVVRHAPNNFIDHGA